MFKRFQDNLAKGPQGAQELIDKLLADAEDPARQPTIYRGVWQALIDELKRRGSLRFALVLFGIRAWLTTARSRVESFAVASTQSLASGLGSLIVATSLTFSALTPAALPVFASSVLVA